MNSTPTFARMDNYPQFSSPDGATHSVAYAVVETTDAEASLARADEIIPEMRAFKLANATVDACLLAVVDIVNLTSTLLVCGRIEARRSITLVPIRPRSRRERRSLRTLLPRRMFLSARAPLDAFRSRRASTPFFDFSTPDVFRLRPEVRPSL